jgi:hypothetical protein
VQSFPQPPQLCGSERTSTQTPLQSSKPAWHSEQRPALQVCPDGQTFPHRPQLLESAAVSTHTPLHKVSPGWHWPVHNPLTHDSPGAQLLLQPPQFAASVWMSTQVSSQHTVPPAQAGVHPTQRPFSQV